MRQERRASHEKCRERRQADVGHRVVAVAPRPFAPVGKTGADLAQLRYQLLNGAHTAGESTIESQGKSKLPDTVASGRKIHNMWQIGLGLGVSQLRSRLTRIENGCSGGWPGRRRGCSRLQCRRLGAWPG